MCCRSWPTGPAARRPVTPRPPCPPHRLVQASLVQATGDPFAGGVTEMALFAQAPPIYGGTDQVQKNIIGERVLGLPKEPNNDRVTPFSELPKNA